MKRKHRYLLVPLALCASLLSLSVALLTSCNGNSNPPAGNDNQSTAESAPVSDVSDADTLDESDADTLDESDAESTAPVVAYQITLRDSNGQPLGNVVLKAQNNGTDVSTKMVGADGIVSFSLPADTYTLTLEAPDGAKLYYDAEAARLTPDTAELTVTVYRGASETYTLNAPSQKNPNAGYTHFDAPLVGEGSTYIELSQDEYTYVVFNPTRAGIYEFTASDGVEFAYHGMPILVFDEPRVSPTDGILSLPVEATSLGGEGISQLVFRAKVAEGTAAENCLFTATRTGDIIKSPEELASWITVEANRADLDALATFREPAEGDKWAALTTGTLTDLDLKSADLTVVLGEDGYYHLGTADGPMVFVRMTSDSPYIEDFVKMCETDHLRAYFYDENGTFLRKEGYNSLINAYGELANADGVVPLNEQLAYTIQNIGRHFGWWNFALNSDIFGDEVFPESVAWLFACAVYR